MIKRIIITMMFLCSIITIFLGISSSILPPLYSSIFLLGYFLLNILIFLFRKKIPILSVILSIIVIVVSIVLSFIFIKADQIIDKITTTDSEITNYSVVVLKKSKYDDIEDIKEKDVGVLDNFDSNYKKALKKLEKKVDVNKKEYSNALELANNLLSKDVDVILLNENYISILNEGITDFEDKIKIIYTIKIKENSTAKKFENESKEINVDKDEAFNIYISGIDTYGAINTVSRSDVNIIATVNPTNSKILLTNVPRDMYVPLYGKEGLNDKLTHAGIYGIDTSIKTIENFLDTKIDYYVRINFNSLISLVDYLGGIDVYSDYEFKAGDRTYTKGLNKNLSGKEALAFSRNRYAFSDGDRQRGRNQEKVIEAILSKVTASRDVNTYLNLVSTLENNFQTSMSKDDIHALINKQIKYNYQWQVVENDVNGYDSYNYTYSYPWQKLYVMVVNESSLNTAKEKIKTTLNEK